MPPMRRVPFPATLGALRATLDCHRLATAVLQDRITHLASVPCALCNRPVAVTSDSADAAAEPAGRAVCESCGRASRVAQSLAWALDRVEPPVEACLAELQMMRREGWVGGATTPDRAAP